MTRTGNSESKGFRLTRDLASWLQGRVSKTCMAAGYPLLPGTGGFAAAIGFGLKMDARSIYLLFPKASLDRNLTAVGEGCVCVRSLGVWERVDVQVGAVDEPEGGYAVASRC